MVARSAQPHRAHELGIGPTLAGVHRESESGSAGRCQRDDLKDSPMNQPVFEQPAVQTAARESAAYLSARYAWYVVALLTLAYVFSKEER